MSRVGEEFSLRCELWRRHRLIASITEGRCDHTMMREFLEQLEGVPIGT
jgi:hypothetical protein